MEYFKSKNLNTYINKYLYLSSREILLRSKVSINSCCIKILQHVLIAVGHYKCIKH